MAWKTFELPKIPVEITTAVDGLKTLTSTTSTGLTAIKGLVEALSVTATTSLSATQEAIKTAAAAIDTAVASLTKDTGIYVLLVPPSRKVIIPEIVKIALNDTADVSPTPERLNVQTMFADKTTTNEEQAILRNIFTATGGNAGFVRTVLESLEDAGDASRPQLADTDAIAGMYIVSGAASFAEIIPFTNGMSAIISPGQPTSLDVPEIPAPQNLKTKVIAGNAIHLQWAYQSTLIELPTFNTFAKVTEVAIIRSTAVQLLSATTPKEIFGKNTLTKGMKSGDGLTEVIAVTPVENTSLTETTYLDTAEHTAGTSYYYCASFHVKLGTSKELEDGGGTDLYFPRLSNVSKVYFPQPTQGTPRSITGVPPDWFRTPRTIDLFPAVGSLLNQVATFALQLSETTTGYGDLLKTNVKALEQQIKGYTALTAKLSAAASSLSAYSSINLGAVSARTFSGTGGLSFLKEDLVKAFGDTSDPNRPPFDGEEFVSGVVLLATTPDAMALLNKVLESVSSGASAIADALAKIDVELATIEPAVFNDNMSVRSPTTTTTTATIAGATTATAADATAAAITSLTTLVGEDSTYCYQSYQPSVEFDDSMNPI
jgi:hypothetical protein